jgi:hypothetical protein
MLATIEHHFPNLWDSQQRGLAISAASSFILASSLAAHSPVIFIVAMLVFQNTGMGDVQLAQNSSIFSAVECSRYGVLALTQLVRNSANMVSVALATTVVVTVMGLRGVEPSLDAVSPQVADAFVDGLRLAFLLMGTLTTVGPVIAFVRGERATPETTTAPRPRVSGASSV